MISRRGSYPHPVLDESDDVSTRFEARELAITMGAVAIAFEFCIDLTDEEITSYLHAGSAELVVRWRCAQTFKLGQLKPQLISTLGDTQKFAGSIAQDDVAGRVQLEFQVVAAKSIGGYLLQAQNIEYASTAFEIRPGDILAMGGTAEFNADKLFDSMDPPVESCFEFLKDPTVAAGVLLDFGNDASVQVRLSEAAFDGFVVHQARPDLQTSTVLMPALMQTLIHLDSDRSQAGEAAETNWGRTIDLLVERYGVGQLSIIEQAQAILNDPVLRTFKEQDNTDTEEK